MADSTARFSNWFQIITNIAILIGLGLVVYELNQSKQLAAAQFVIDGIQRQTDIQIAMMGEDPREALAKSAIHPADLNERDVVALDAYYDSVVAGWFGQAISRRIGGIDDPYPWQLAVVDSVQRDFSTEPGRRWLRAWAATMDDTSGIVMKVAEVVEKALQDDSGGYRQSRYELLLAND
jgi:hypothetical protein